MNGEADRMVCTGCGHELAPDDPAPYRCPEADGDDVDHVLAPQLDLDEVRFPSHGDENPFVRFRELLFAYRYARVVGKSDEDYVALVRELDAKIARVAGTGFRFTPYVEAELLARDIGVRSLWIKDETHNVSGSHKARHLMGLALQISARPDRKPPRLAIASCGNAALAAAVVARAAGWELTTFVPPHANSRVLDRLTELGAELVFCERHPEEPAGDPCALRFREAVQAGALPFTVQGTENGLAVEGGSTLAWELVTQHLHADAPPLDLVVIQVGGGALGSSFVQGLRTARSFGVLERLPRFAFVQTEGGHPLERAWGLVLEQAKSAPLGEVLVDTARHRSEYMWPWEVEPHSVATGILDDETYDWRVLVEAMVETNGGVVVASEDDLLRANTLARELSGIDADETGTAGLAGLLELVEQGAAPVEGCTAVLFTGARR